jgi:hypothetical protein
MAAQILIRIKDAGQNSRIIRRYLIEALNGS